MDKMDERLARMEELLHQLIGLVGKTNSGLVDLESRLNQRLERIREGHHREVTILKSESDHLAGKVGVLERDLAVLRSQS